MSRGQNNISKIARKTDHDRKTVRKYLKNPQPDGPERTWRTRANPFEEVWEEIKELVRINPRLEAKTVFESLDEKYPGKFSSGQLRTLQRHIKIFKARGRAYQRSHVSSKTLSRATWFLRLYLHERFRYFHRR